MKVARFRGLLSVVCVLLFGCSSSSGAPSGNGTGTTSSTSTTAGAAGAVTATGTSAAAAVGSASGSAAPMAAADAGPAMLPDPTDETERIAHLISDSVVGGWLSSWYYKHVDTVPQRALDKECAAKKGAACAVAAWGYDHRGLDVLAEQRGQTGCALGNDDACLFLYYRYVQILRHWVTGQDHVRYVVPDGEEPRKFVEKRVNELCDSGHAAGCYLSAALLDEPDIPLPPDAVTPDRFKLPSPAYDYYLRSCVLGAARGCSYALLYLRAAKEGTPGVTADAIKVVSAAEHVCERRAGACQSLAELVEHDGPIQRPDLGAKLRERGCSHKEDLTWEEKGCQ